MYMHFDTDDFNESKIHSLEQDVKKLKTQIEERDLCIRELQKIIKQIQETLEVDRRGNVYSTLYLTEKAVDRVKLLCKNSADNIIQKVIERRKEK